MKRIRLIFLIIFIMLIPNVKAEEVYFWRLSEGKYTCYTKNKICPNGWIQSRIGSKIWWYYIENGTYVSNEFRKFSDGKMRYLGADGKMVVSATNYNIGDKYYNFDSNGNYTISGYGDNYNDISSFIQRVDTTSGDLYNNNNKELLSSYYNRGGVITTGQIDALNNHLRNRVINASNNNKIDGSRASVVAAARFLSLEFKYGINYYLDEVGNENGYQADYFKEDDYDNSGKSNLFNPTSKFINLFDYNIITDKGSYNQIGLNLNTYQGWGKKVDYRYYNSNYDGGYCANCLSYGTNYWNKGYRYYDYNGLDCSGFITWSLINGGVNYQGVRYYDYPNYIKSSNNVKKISTSNKKNIINEINNGSILAGDLLWKSDHVAMILGIDKSTSTIYVAEETTYSYNLNTALGASSYRSGADNSSWRLRVTAFNYNDTNSTLYTRFTTVIKMGNIYSSKGNYTDLWTDEYSNTKNNNKKVQTINGNRCYAKEKAIVYITTCNLNSDGSVNNNLTCNYTSYNGKKITGEVTRGDLRLSLDKCNK